MSARAIRTSRTGCRLWERSFSPEPADERLAAAYTEKQRRRLDALKYLDPHRSGVIRVFGQEESGIVTYWVEDNGVGVAQEHQDAIYKIFHRLDPQHGSGEGLGLAIVRRVIDRHAGEIRLESAPNKGSTFYLSLPNG